MFTCLICERTGDFVQQIVDPTEGDVIEVCMGKEAAEECRRILYAQNEAVIGSFDEADLIEVPYDAACEERSFGEDCDSQREF